MSGAGDDTLYVSSWGWLDKDGGPVEPGGTATFRLWSVTMKRERVGFLAMAPDVGSIDVLVAAYRAWVEC